MARFPKSQGIRTSALEVQAARRPLLTRRQAMQAGVAGFAGLAGGKLLQGHAGAAEPEAPFPGMGDPADGMSYDSGPSPRIHRIDEPSRIDRMRRDSVALNQQTVIAARERDGGIQPFDLGGIDSVLWGTGLYVGNEWHDWTDSTRYAVIDRVANWGFNFITPKVGGYGSTWYGSDTQLRNWRDHAWNDGIGFAPFIYSIPNSRVRDAQICSEIANAVGVAIVDMEDEWAGAHSAMTEFGNVFRSYNPYDIICVTGYGDPITRFGQGVFPSAEVTQFADGYMPQWYYGVWSIYNQSGVIAAINWADNELAIEFGGDYPQCPNMSIYTIYHGRRTLSDQDLSTGEEYAWNWNAPIIWWEYSDMNDEIAYYCQN